MAVDLSDEAVLRVVEAALAATPDLKADNIMLIGALCRNALHRRLGHSFAMTSTYDLDLALAEQVSDALLTLHRAAAAHPDTPVDPALIAAETVKIRHALLAATHPAGAIGRKHRALARRIHRREVDYLKFASDPAIPFTNNPAEQEIRMTKIRQKFLRRFDIEHTFRLFKQALGWTAPKIRTPYAADRWTWIVMAAHTQLRLARPLAEDQPQPWERVVTTGRLTPARVRRGFPRIRAMMPVPAAAPKFSRPGPGRPPGTKNNQLTPHHPVGKTPKTDSTS